MSKSVNIPRFITPAILLPLLAMLFLALNPVAVMAVAYLPALFYVILEASR